MPPVARRWKRPYWAIPTTTPVQFRPDGTNFTTFDRDERWTWFRPALAGKYLVDYYRGTGELPPLVEHPGVLNVSRRGLCWPQRSRGRCADLSGAGCVCAGRSGAGQAEGSRLTPDPYD